jgi:hypothetical protein
VRFSLSRFALPLLLSLVAGCGPTLTRGPTGWHDSAFPFSIAPLDDGALVSKGWRLAEYTATDQGFRREDTAQVTDLADLELKRIEDDGALFVVHYTIDDDDRSKLPEVFAERWLDRIVANPKDDMQAAKFRAVVPKLETTATGTVGWRSVSETILHGHTMQVDSRETFPVPACEAIGLTVTIAPPGSPPDHRLYVAVIKPTAGTDYAIVAYGNTPTMFDRGLEDARSFARRLRF